MRTNFEYTGGASVFFSAYVECALWSSVDTNGEPLDDNYAEDDIAPETVNIMQADCIDFVSENIKLLEDLNAAQAGHDFWLTRNRHGSGFWDRTIPTGDALTLACRAYSSQDLYVGDDGKIYI